MFKHGKKILAITLMLGMCLGSMTFALAAPSTSTTTAPTTPSWSIPVGTSTNPAKATITKLLMIPKGADVPPVFFRFEATPISINDDTTKVDKMPFLGDSGTADSIKNSIFLDMKKAGSTTVTVGDIQYVRAESRDILSLVSYAGHSYKQEGIHKYKLIEDKNIYKTSYSSSTITLNDNDEIIFSEAEYTLLIYVKKDGSTYYPSSAVAIVDVPDYPGQQVGVKVDPTPDTSNNDTNDDYDGDGLNDGAAGHSKLVFTNKYVWIFGQTDPKNPDLSINDKYNLRIYKNVIGSFASIVDKFKFTLSIKPHEYVGQTFTDNNKIIEYKTYKGFIRKSTAGYATEQELIDIYKIDPSFVGTYSKDGKDYGYITFKADDLYVAGEPRPTFFLAHNESIDFYDIHVGSIINITEIEPVDYVPSYRLGGIAGPAVANPIGVTMTTPDYYLRSSTNVQYIINTRNDVTPTGLDINNLPFVVMIVLALMGVTGFITYKSRRKKNAELA